MNVTKKKIAKKVALKASTKKVAKKKVALKTVAKKTPVKKDAKKLKVAAKKALSKKVAAKNVAAKKISSKTVALKAPIKKRRRRGISVSEAAREAETDSRGYAIINGRKVRLISTNGVSKKKKRSKPKIALVDLKGKVKLKTHLTAKQLRVFRDKLMQYRNQLLIDLGAIEKEALDVNSDVSHMPIHMADVGSDAYDQDLKLGMAASERKRIRDIEEALVRIKKKTYGVCYLTGSVIPDARLNAKPWAKYTKESAEKIERMNRSR